MSTIPNLGGPDWMQREATNQFNTGGIDAFWEYADNPWRNLTLDERSQISSGSLNPNSFDMGGFGWNTASQNFINQYLPQYDVGGRFHPDYVAPPPVQQQASPTVVDTTVAGDTSNTTNTTDTSNTVDTTMTTVPQQIIEYQAPELPFLNELPNQQQTLLQSIQNSDTMSGFGSGWSDAFNDAPGFLDTAASGYKGLSPYAITGDPTYGSALTNDFGVSGDYTTLRNNLAGVLSGTTDLPFLSDLLSGFRTENEAAMEQARAGLASRGVLNSTPGTNELERLRTRNQANLAGISLDALSRGTAPMLQALGQMGSQDLGRQTAEIGRQQAQETAGRAGQQQAFGQGLAKNQALANIGQALGQMDLTGRAQDFSQQYQQNAQEGALLQQIFNQGMGVQDRALNQFLSMNNLQNTFDTTRQANQNAAINQLMSVLTNTALPNAAPGFTAPVGGPSTTQSLMQLLMTPGIQNSPFGSWLFGGGS
jgi:hypothetical protein